MLEVVVPGRGKQIYDQLVLDFNGTLARDGELLPGMVERLRALSPLLSAHVLTADTFGSAATSLADLPLQLTILDPEHEGEAKASLVKGFGADRTVAVGNGANDAAMLDKAGLSIVVNGPEGCACETLLAADIVAIDIGVALDLLLKPERLIATWRR
jgi:soluble P-type ATPase